MWRATRRVSSIHLRTAGAWLRWTPLASWRPAMPRGRLRMQLMRTRKAVLAAAPQPSTSERGFRTPQRRSRRPQRDRGARRWMWRHSRVRRGRNDFAVRGCGNSCAEVRRRRCDFFSQHRSTASQRENSFCIIAKHAHMQHGTAVPNGESRHESQELRDTVSGSGTPTQQSAHQQPSARGAGRPSPSPRAAAGSWRHGQRQIPARRGGHPCSCRIPRISF